MIEERYGKYILDDGDAPLRALFEGETETISETLEGTSGKPLKTVVVPNGMLTRYNKKSVTVITDTGEHWNIAPAFLRKAEESGGSVRPDPKNVIRLSKK